MKPLIIVWMQASDLDTYCAALSDLGIDYEKFYHPSMKNAVDVLQHLGLQLTDSIPTLIMKADSSFIAVLLRGDMRMDSKKIKKHLRIKNLRMASREEFIEVTGLPVGAARVFNPELAALIDSQVFEQDYLMGGSGVFDCTIKYKCADLRKIPNCEVMDLTKS